MSKTLSFENTLLTVAGRELDFGTLPEKSIAAILRRGFTHYFGSEIASKVKARKDQFIAANEGAEMSDEAIESLKAELVAEGFTKLAEGTLGDRAVGQSVDPVEALVESLAKAEVKDILRANNVKVPKKDELVVFADKSTHSLDDLVARRIASHGERLEKEAKKQIAAKAKAKAALAVSAEVITADALGL